MHETHTPDSFLKGIGKLMQKQTSVYINVPNANSIHRLIAIEMGIIDNIFEKSDRNKYLSQKEIFDKDKQIERLKNERKAAVAETDIAVLKAKADLEKEIIELNNNIKNADTEKDLQIQSLKNTHRTEVQAKDEIIRIKDDEIERVKDMKAKMSVKEIGEKLGLTRMRICQLEKLILKKIKESKVLDEFK